jgi:hypothetical protein
LTIFEVEFEIWFLEMQSGVLETPPESHREDARDSARKVNPTLEVPTQHLVGLVSFSICRKPEMLMFVESRSIPRGDKMCELRGSLSKLIR